MFKTIYNHASSQAAAAPLLANVRPGGMFLNLSIGVPPSQAQRFKLDLDADVSLFSCASSASATDVPCSASLLCPSKLCSSSEQCLHPVSKRTSVPLQLQTVELFSTDASSFKPVAPVPVAGIAFGCRAGGRAVAGMSRSSLSLPVQIGRVQQAPPKFTLCPSPTSASRMIFGDAPAITIGGIRFGSSSFTTVPLASNAVHPSRYYLPLQRIRVVDVQGQELGATPPNAFAIDRSSGSGGMKVSSTERYTKLVGPAYAAVRDAFRSFIAARNLALLPAMGELELCFNASSLSGNRLGLVVPEVQLEMQAGNASWSWTLAGSSVVAMASGSSTACLAFLGAGSSSSLGMHQQFDNLLQFDAGPSPSFGFIDRGLHLLRLNCAAAA